MSALHPKCLFVLTLGLALVGGCAPNITTYRKIDAPGAIYFNASCSGGPASIAYNPFHGIYISFNAVDFNFGLHVPEGYTVQLNGTSVKINGVISGTPYKESFEMEATKHSYTGAVVPSQFFVLPDPYTAPNNFGPLEGSGAGKYLRWYRFIPKRQGYEHPLVPKELTEGTIEIPAMMINGQHYDSQRVPFKREHYVGIESVNC